jgi:hypothetical protein
MTRRSRRVLRDAVAVVLDGGHEDHGGGERVGARGRRGGKKFGGRKSEECEGERGWEEKRKSVFLKRRKKKRSFSAWPSGSLSIFRGSLGGIAGWAWRSVRRGRVWPDSDSSWARGV